jgi:hypothetical protein
MRGMSGRDQTGPSSARVPHVRTTTGTAQHVDGDCLIESIALDAEVVAASPASL